jgi:hypothetical protein
MAQARRLRQTAPAATTATPIAALIGPVALGAGATETLASSTSSGPVAPLNC